MKIQNALIMISLCGFTQFAQASVRPGTYVLQEDNGRVIEARVSGDEESGQSLYVIQVVPPLKQMPIRYDLVKRGSISSAFDFGDLEARNLRSNVGLGGLVSYAVPLTKRIYLRLTNARGEEFTFMFDSDLN